MTTSTLLNIKDIIGKSARWLDAKGVESARLDAELLLAHILGMSRLDLYVSWDRPVEEAEKNKYRELLKRRAEFEPVAYILGRKEFFSLEFKVTPEVLTPRPETELLVERILEIAEKDGEGAGEGEDRSEPLRIADVGTGSGAIAVALAVHLPEARIVATDISSGALEVAMENARTHGVAERIKPLNISLLEGLEGPFDWIASNPPYIPESDRDSLPPDVVRHEPHEALFSGEDGLEAIRALIPQAADRLRPGGWLVLEIGAGQSEEVLRLLEENGNYEPGEVKRDYRGIERIVSARRIS